VEEVNPKSASGFIYPFSSPSLRTCSLFISVWNTHNCPPDLFSLTPFTFPHILSKQSCHLLSKFLFLDDTTRPETPFVGNHFVSSGRDIRATGYVFDEQIRAVVCGRSKISAGRGVYIPTSTLRKNISSSFKRFRSSMNHTCVRTTAMIEIVLPFRRSFRWGHLLFEESTAQKLHKRWRSLFWRNLGHEGVVKERLQTARLVGFIYFSSPAKRVHVHIASSEHTQGLTPCA